MPALYNNLRDLLLEARFQIYDIHLNTFKEVLAVKQYAVQVVKESADAFIIAQSSFSPQEYKVITYVVGAVIIIVIACVAFRYFTGNSDEVKTLTGFVADGARHSATQADVTENTQVIISDLLCLVKSSFSVMMEKQTDDREEVYQAIIQIYKILELIANKLIEQGHKLSFLAHTTSRFLPPA